MKAMLRTGAVAVAAALALAAPAAAIDQETIDKSVQRGVAALRQGQDGNGAWHYSQDAGMTALAGLTLLECDAPANDKAVMAAAAFIRKSAITEHQTYSLALSILFLERLGDPADLPLIQSMAVRLMGGQTRAGGWTYDCPAPSPREQERLGKIVQGQGGELVGRRELPKPREGKRDPKDLPVEVQQEIVDMARRAAPPAVPGDNSNTQFATLALWVARRRGMPAEAALAAVEKRFRASQHADGGWSYDYRGPGGVGRADSAATMTAAGLLCIAVSDATANDAADNKEKPARDVGQDKNLRAGLAVLGHVIGHPIAKQRELGLPGVIPQVGGQSYYFFWSLERVCVAMDLRTIGGKDWHQWGAEIVVANQQADGTWKGGFGPADTCFALLFLRRANLAQDLTTNLKGKITDGGETTLKSGGVGGDGLKDVSMKALDGKDAKVPPSGGARGLDDKTERGKLAKEVVDAGGAKQERLIAQYRDAKGVAYTEALAGAIPHLSGETKMKARDALAERLARMTPNTLTDYLKDDEAEIRRAAALACALKESKAHVPQLIDMLRETDPAVERAVVAALKDLTGQNFGPPADATPEQRDKAIAAWKGWWAKQQK
jgi:hypothetical protein